jgi:uncharacterized surface protein with fasciclin (FAS1) repeats
VAHHNTKAALASSDHGKPSFFHIHFTGNFWMWRLSAQDFPVNPDRRIPPMIRAWNQDVGLSMSPDIMSDSMNRRPHMLRRTYLALTAATMIAGPTFAYAGSKDIVDTAVEAGSFSTLVAAVQAAGLVDTLKGEGPFTVFAPTDEAFAALPEGTVQDLLKEENKDQLTAILTYHVVPGKVMSSDLTNDMNAETVQGGTVNIMTEGGVTVNGANVVTADVEASNGVIHVIDAVIMPQ